MFACVLVVAAALAGTGLPYNTFSRDGKLSVEASGCGLWRVAHSGRQDWALTAWGGERAVRPGEVWRIVCRGAADGTNAVRASVSAVLYGADGKALSWSFAARPLQAAGVTTNAFAIPQDAAKIVCRVAGSGPSSFAVGALGVERIEAGVAADVGRTLTVGDETVAVAVDTCDLGLSVTDRRTGRTWSGRASGGSFSPYLVREVVARERGFVRMRVREAVSLCDHELSLRLDPSAPGELVVSLKGEGPMAGPLVCPRAFVGRTGDSFVVPMSEGFLLPVGEKVLWMDWLPAYKASLSMPFMGMAGEGEKDGVMAILETPDDAGFRIVNEAAGPVGFAPCWMPSRRRFGYERRVRFVFLEKGGYVAMAKRYRAFARERGLLKTFAEKAKERPNVARLPGAANVWYFPRRGEPSAPAVAKEMQAAGIARLLWSGNTSFPDDVKAIAALPETLVGRYDCYRDVYYPAQMAALGMKPNANGHDICSNTSAWPDDVVWDTSDPNSWRRGWSPRRDRATSCAVQCALRQPRRLMDNVAWEMERKPFTARFIDVTTSSGWEECEHPAHPMTRTACREAMVGMLGALGRRFDLVVGSEQGMDAAVPVCDYFEGMLSPWAARMPHGRPGAGRPEIFRDPFVPTNVTSQELARVADVGLSPKYRIPLFELVYHDCCCAHWYWYDYSNRPLCLWNRRDLFNALYGTAPMYIFDYRHWTEHRAEFLKSYALIGPIARRTGFSEMVSHRFLSPDRRVQRTEFADGTVVIANFGDRPVSLPEATVPANAAWTSDLR